MYGTTRLAVLPATSVACTVKLNLPSLFTAIGFVTVQVLMPEPASLQLNGVPTKPFMANARFPLAGVIVGAPRSSRKVALPVAPSSATASTVYTPLASSRGGAAGLYGSSAPSLIRYWIDEPGCVILRDTGARNQVGGGLDGDTAVMVTVPGVCGDGATNPVDLPPATATLPAESTTCTE